MNMDLKTTLKNKLSKKELDLVPRSFDTIGNIAIFSDFPKELKSKEKLIGNALIKLNKNIKTVAKKTGKHAGIYRTKKIKIIAGEKTKETIHKESGIMLKLNVETCYFSPRWSNERLRIAKQVKKNESVLVMFSGIAPFPLVMAKNAKPKEVYGIEINPEAHEYALENVLLNKFGDRIKLFNGNVKTILPKLNKKFDRIIMPLPKTAHNYTDLALKHIKKGGIIHIYDFAKKEDFPFSLIKKLSPKLKVLRAVKCGVFSPKIDRVCLDVKA